MLNGRSSQIAVGRLLLAIGLVGLVLAGARAVILIAYRHVIVETSNAGSTLQVSVNCSQAVVVAPGEEGETTDLGLISPDDLVFFSATSHDRNPSWGFRATSNGHAFFDATHGHVRVPGPLAPANAVVMAKAFTAGGHHVASIGCQPAEISAVPDYVQSPDDAKVPAAAGGSPYQAPHPLYDQVDALGRWSLTVLAVLGFAATLGSRSIRELAWSQRARGGGVASILGILLTVLTSIALGVLLTALTVAGVVLLFGVSHLLRTGLEGPAGTGGT